MLLLLTLLACRDEPPSLGVYRSGPNAVTRDALKQDVLVWGAAGTFKRVPTQAPGGASYLGEAGPLWIVDREIPAPVKAVPVDAAMVERAGFRLREVLAPAATATPAGASAPDAAKAGGVYVRSMVKVRRTGAPPVYVVTATGDEVGAGRFDGPQDVRRGENCRAAVGLLDHTGEKLLASARLDAATRTCAVPQVVPPVDRDGDGVQDVLIHGQNGDKGFRTWFRLEGAGLAPGPEDAWESIP